MVGYERLKGNGKVPGQLSLVVQLYCDNCMNATAELTPEVNWFKNEFLVLEPAEVEKLQLEHDNQCPYIAQRQSAAS